MGVNSLAPRKFRNCVQLWKNQDLLVTGRICHDTGNHLSNGAGSCAAAASSTIGVNGSRGLRVGPGLSEDGRDGEERGEEVHWCVRGSVCEWVYKKLRRC